MQPIVGYNYGAVKFDRMFRCLWLAIACATAILLVGWGLSMLFPRQIARIFTTDATLLDLAAKGIKLDMLVFFVVGSQATITNFFQCIGKVKVSIFLSLSRQLFLLLPMAYVFPLLWDLDGVWYAMPASDFGSFAMTIPMLIWYMKKSNTHEAYYHQCRKAAWKRGARHRKDARARFPGEVLRQGNHESGGQGERIQ
jgi:Na+-driven multidrug efflux pump